jgi:uncharacterized protein YecE (DUF72 family)
MNAAQPWQPYEIPPDLTGRGFYVGTSGYYYDDWIGLFNPPKTRIRGLSEEQKADQDRLLFYQKYFAFVEINATFYHEPSLTQFLDIESRSAPRTKYTVKVHQDVSHTKKWDTSAGIEAMERHICGVSPLIETGRFYSFLIQLEDHLQRSQSRLDYFMSVASVAVRRQIDVHIEFRHISWHDLHVLQTLKDNGVGICNTEIPPVKHAFPLKAYATTDKGYIRYNGLNLDHWYPKGRQETPQDKIASRNARYDYEYSDAELAKRMGLQLILSHKTTNIAIAFNNHYQSQAVRNAIENLKMLAEKFKKKESKAIEKEPKAQ